MAWRIGSGASWVDRLIGWGERKTGQTNSDKVNYYHVGIVGPTKDHFYQSAIFGGVRNSDVPNPLPNYIEVYRFKEPLSQDDLTKMWTYANAQLGKGYNYVGVLTAGWLQIAGKPFC